MPTRVVAGPEIPSPSSATVFILNARAASTAAAINPEISGIFRRHGYPTRRTSFRVLAKRDLVMFNTWEALAISGSRGSFTST